MLFSAGEKVRDVSNIGTGTDPWAKAGNGSIAKVGLDGKVIATEWVKGFAAPKGLGLLAHGKGPLFWTAAECWR